MATNWSLKGLINDFLNKNTNNQNKKSVEDVEAGLKVTDMEVNIESLKQLNLVCTEKNDKIYMRIDVPKCERRRPITFVCLIDVSGSMSSSVGEAEGKKIFSRLDIVKHVLRVLITVLQDDDNLCLITFSDTANIVLELSRMTKQNKLLAKNHVNGLRTYCNTYTGPALKAAYNEITKAPKNHVKSIILLTDGYDTAGDDMVLNMFDRIQKPEMTQLNTFGFSNDINSSCLEKLAKQGGGIFGFIPDQSMIGTIFINFMANTFLTFAQDVNIEINKEFFEFEHECQPKKISLQFGQKRYFIIRRKSLNNNQLPTLKIGFDESNMIELNCQSNSLSINETEIEEQNSRYELLKFLFDKHLPNLDLSTYEGLKRIKVSDFLSEFQQNGPGNNLNFEQLKLSIKFWKTWGAHYLKSFAFAHLFEQSLNFKAPSMKIYNYEDFNNMVYEFTDLFCSLPPPTATSRASSATNSSATASVIPSISFANMMNVNGGCIFENCKIKMKSGWKPISKVRKGELVANGAKVICVLKTRFNGPLIQINKLSITPYHPIFYDHRWIFPKDALKSKIIHPQNETIVYNLVLDKIHVINVEGTDCITLGHGYDQGLLKHSYYGTDKVLKEISGFRGWNDGFISIHKFDVIRDKHNLVCKTIVTEYEN